MNSDSETLEELYWSRIEASRMSFTQADVDFMTGMIAHHAQALIMSRIAPENHANPTVQTLAARIINAQDDEIATMQKWLRDRDQPVPMVHIDGLNLMIHMDEPEQTVTQNEMSTGHSHHHRMNEERGMNDHDMSHHHDMPGMLTRQQLEQLAEAKGPDFDRLFLEFMIEHHEGAVYMVRELFAANGAANDTEAFELASEIHAEQVTEINRMKLMLGELED